MNQILKQNLLKSICILLIAGCTSVKQKSYYPEWLNKAVFYQIYPQSFKDGNGDGIGDIKGMTEKLPYVKSLGVTAIWLNPVFESTFRDAGYDVTDFYKVAPRYGNNDDLRQFMSKAHQLGLKVCLDLVAGHTSIDHPWFIKSAQAKPNVYTDRYIWTSSKDIKPEKFVSGSYERAGNYQKNFFETQPALNYGYANPNPNHPWEQSINAPGPVSTREELKKIMAYWMDMGADGFRVDMASSLIKNDPKFTETNKLWGGIRSWFTSKYPDGVLVAEWSYPAQAIKAGFMLDFLIHFNAKGYPSLFFDDTAVVLKAKDPFFAKAGKGSPMEFVNSYLFQKKQVGDAGLIAVPTANHDFQRLRSGGRNNDDELKVALAFLLTWQSVPFIYYGDEIGMKFVSNPLPDKEGSVFPFDIFHYVANRAGSRTPMQWSSAKNAGFSTADSTSLYLPVDVDSKRPTVENEEKVPNSLLNFVRSLIKLRSENMALGNTGGLQILYAKDKKYPLVYERSDAADRFIITVNPKGEAVQLNLNGFKDKKLTPVLTQNCSIKYRHGDLRLQMQGVSFGIYKVAPMN
ncbi:alpha-amylase family glycosyl hydrolase [Pedobacter sp. L105]|uniref:alpha-amylase family glycosyl hydrolase n=1 Tax=Pedobacter sp. L105 TaxID=1641871 RepID=UPI00131A8BFC|nr:alpha-amylase family glycosyl hydrolase [Pedobacter sp. L105]